MNKRLALLFCLAAAGCSVDTDSQLDQAQGAQPLVVRAYFQDVDELAKLTAEHAPWEVHHDQGYAVIELASRAEIDRLERAGYEITIEHALSSRLNALPTEAEIQATIPGFPCYRTVEETFASAQRIADDNPKLASFKDIGDSWEKLTLDGGHDIKVLRLTNDSVAGPKPVLFAMAAIHAREYTTAELLTRFAEHLIGNYGLDADATWLLDHHEIHLVLQSNPDGRKHAETGRLWRKNTNRDHCGPNTSRRGADLNRNFPFGWGAGDGSSGNACSDTYRGASPASEPETAAITEYVRSIFPDQRDETLGRDEPAPADATGVFLDIHSYSELVLWPWGFGDEPAPNGAALETLGRKLAFFNDYEPFQAVNLYPTDGTTDDFAYGELGLAAYTFELGTWFFEECSTFERTVLPDNLNALIYAAKVARTPYLTPAGPETLGVTLEDKTVSQGALARLSALADDDRSSDRNGSLASQAVVAAEVYVDVPPWSAGASPIALRALDGSYDQAAEAVTVELDTAGMSEGRHLLYVRAQDADGNWGPVSAAFLTVAPVGVDLPPL